jgi:poly-gamma-glutamate synthesis protein (capsule biosynthesis protein)
VRGIELHRGKPILYGCGDLINDYEGIPKSPRRNSYAPELGLIYFVRLAGPANRIVQLSMRPIMHRMRIRHAADHDAARLCDILNRESAKWGTRVVNENATLRLEIPA